MLSKGGKLYLCLQKVKISNTLTLQQTNVVFAPEVETFSATMVAKLRKIFLLPGPTVASQEKPVLSKQKLDGVASPTKYQIKVTG